MLRITAIVALLGTVGAADAASIVGSKHDLRVGGGVQICVFCHTPHNASTQAGLGLTPLWNRRITDPTAFVPYSSPTMSQTCSTRPSGISMVCLSCHDGTTASGMSAVAPTDVHFLLNSTKIAIPNEISLPIHSDGGADCMKCHTSTVTNTMYSKALTVMGGPDLTNDHPISMPYPVGKAKYNAPPDLQVGWPNVKLFSGRVECPTCHSVHDPQNPPFLRMANDQSQLCYNCHSK